MSIRSDMKLEPKHKKEKQLSWLCLHVTNLKLNHIVSLFKKSVQKRSVTFYLCRLTALGARAFLIRAHDFLSSPLIACF